MAQEKRYKEFKSDNTNLAILCSHNFNEPFNQPIAFAQKVGELTNMLGAGHILVQRYGDILDGKRTWPKAVSYTHLHRNSKLIRKLNRIPGRIGYCPPPARERLIASDGAV